MVGERYVSFKEKFTSYCVLALLVMTLTGLYLRWPRGNAWKRWASWLKINFKLKGAAFLWSLHAVVGTVVLCGFLMSAHSGLAMSEILWYADGFSKIAGTTYDHGVIRGADVRAQNATINRYQYDLDRLWATFNKIVPDYRTATIEFAQSTPQFLQVSYLYKNVVGGVVSGRDISKVRLDTASGNVLLHDKFSDKPVLKRVLLQNFDIHSGNVFGLPGRIFIMFTSLMMPVLMVTGWMIYLNRRRRKARARAAQGAV
ncbi:MAG: PepSY-associated TM helix domain-containing protein [Steroidobacteraceae bacterium]